MRTHTLPGITPSNVVVLEMSLAEAVTTLSEFQDAHRGTYWSVVTYTVDSSGRLYYGAMWMDDDDVIMKESQADSGDQAIIDLAKWAYEAMA